MIKRIIFPMVAMLLPFCSAGERPGPLREKGAGELIYTHIFIGELQSNESKDAADVQLDIKKVIIDSTWQDKFMHISYLRFGVVERLVGQVNSTVIFSPIGYLFEDEAYWGMSNAPIYLELGKRYIVMLCMPQKDIELKNIRDARWDKISIIGINESTEQAQIRELITRHQANDQPYGFVRKGGCLYFDRDAYKSFITQMKKQANDKNKHLYEIVSCLGRPLFGWGRNGTLLVVYAGCSDIGNTTTFSMQGKSLIYLLFENGVFVQCINQRDSKLVP